MREYVLVFLVACSVTYLLTVVARELAIRWGAVAAVRDRDVHAEATPYMGGVAMYGGMVAAYFVARQLPFLSDNYSFMFADVGYVLLAGGLICFVGVLDDVLDIDAWTKMGGQVLAAGVLVMCGIQFYFIPTLDGTQFSLGPPEGALATIILVVATVNAVNFVDGLDGLASGMIGIAAVALFFFCYQLSDAKGMSLATAGALLAVLLAGACAGFLPHNFNPARIFMGDSGSMLLGLVLSASALTLTGQFSGPELSGADGDGPSIQSLILPLLLPCTLLLVPLADMVLAIVRRTRAGVSPFTADKHHLHHRLLELGHSQRRAVLIMWTWSGLIAFGFVIASLYTGPKMWTTLGVGLVVAVVATLIVPRLPNPIEGRHEPEPARAPEEPGLPEGPTSGTPAPLDPR